MSIRNVIMWFLIYNIIFLFLLVIQSLDAILLPHVCHFNLMSRVERFAEIAVALGENV